MVFTKERIRKAINETLNNDELGEPVLFFGFTLSRAEKVPEPNAFGIEKAAYHCDNEYLIPTVNFVGEQDSIARHHIQKAIDVLHRLAEEMAADR